MKTNLFTYLEETLFETQHTLHKIIKKKMNIQIFKQIPEEEVSKNLPRPNCLFLSFSRYKYSLFTFLLLLLLPHSLFLILSMTDLTTTKK